MTEAVLETRELSKQFGGFRAVNNVNLRLRQGEVHALIGPNGAGKTTVFNLLTKFVQPTTGTIFFEGTDVTRLKPEEVARLGLARSFQISSVFPEMTVQQNVRIAIQRRKRMGHQFWRSLQHLDVLEDEILETLREVGLESHLRSRAEALPYGLKRVLEFATTVALAPRVMLLDEPMAGLGVEDISRIAELIRAAAKRCSILMVEHNLRAVETLSDHITVLQRGEVLADGNYETVSNDPRVIEAYLGGKSSGNYVL